MTFRARLIVIDDDETIRRTVTMVLETAGFSRVTAFADAESAFEELGLDRAEANRAPVCDLVLTDIMMPGIDGIEACARIRASRRYRDIPIVVFSGASEQPLLQQVFLAGAHDFIAKPLQISDLVARVHAALRFRREVARRRTREQALLAALGTRIEPEVGASVEREQQSDAATARAVAQRLLAEAAQLDEDGELLRRVLSALASQSREADSPRGRAIAARLARDIVDLTAEEADVGLVLSPLEDVQS